MQDQITWLKALADPTRLRVVVALAHGDLSVTDLTLVLRQSQPRVSRHLKLMTEAGLIERFKEGAWVFYRLAEGTQASGFVAAVLPFLQSGGGDFARDGERLTQVREERRAQAERYFAEHAGDWNALHALDAPEAAVEAAIVEAFAGRTPSALLDIGTGTGRILDVMAGQISKGTGIDLSREMLAVARARLTDSGRDHCQVRLGDMYALPVHDGEFDAAVLHQVLHFAEDPAAVIREAARALGPGGRLVVADLAPHDREDLRTTHAHRRLGFADPAMDSWMTAAGLVAAPTVTIPGTSLTVKLWIADKPEKDAGR
jgi:SAM-dependent methyltransferase